ncbi:hypothetical protein JCM8097_008452 [Rhodosporidiobolus ruineniae]
MVERGPALETEWTGPSEEAEGSSSTGSVEAAFERDPLVEEEKRSLFAYSTSFPPLLDPMNTLRRARSAFALSPSSSPRLESSSPATSTTEDQGFFSWSRWYGGAPKAKRPESLSNPPPPSDDISRLVRAAIRRNRALDEGTSSVDSELCLSPALSVGSSDGSDRFVLSPSSTSASTSDEWPWDVAVPELSGDDTDSSSLASSVSTTSSKASNRSPSRLKNALSSSTLRIRVIAPPPAASSGKLLRRSVSRAALSTAEAEVAPHSPSSPSFSSGFSSPSLSAPTSESPSLRPVSAFSTDSDSTVTSLSISTRLRRAASTATLRSLNPFRHPSSQPPSSGSFHTSPSTSTPPSPALSSAPSSSGAAVILRDLLLRHDSSSEPPPLPLSGVLPSLPSNESLNSLSSFSTTTSSEESDYGAPFSFSNLQYHQHRPKESVSSVSSMAAFYPGSSLESADTSDPFAPVLPSSAQQRHRASSSASSGASLSFIRHSAAGRSQADLADAFPEDVVPDCDADVFVDADSLASLDFSSSDCSSSSATAFDAPDSPSEHYPPFDPFAITSSALSSSSSASPSSAPPMASTRPSPPREPTTPKLRPARILTKQRSFVDPRTHTLRTAPGVVVTPSTPERGSMFPGRGGGEDRDAMRMRRG